MQINDRKMDEMIDKAILGATAGALGGATSIAPLLVIGCYMVIFGSWGAISLTSVVSIIIAVPFLGVVFGAIWGVIADGQNLRTIAGTILGMMLVVLYAVTGVLSIGLPLIDALMILCWGVILGLILGMFSKSGLRSTSGAIGQAIRGAIRGVIIGTILGIIAFTVHVLIILLRTSDPADPDLGMAIGMAVIGWIYYAPINGLMLGAPLGGILGAVFRVIGTINQSQVV
jgi:hypothetical protein